jgi:nucleotide-binding universal stress UspA family protein
MADQSPRKVLLAIDGSVAADRAAAYVARNAAALDIREVDVLNVQNVPSYHTHAERGSPIPLDVIEFSTKVTATARRLLDAANVRHRLDTQLGEPADTIVHAAEANGVGEIVIGSRGMSQLAGLVLGSVAYKVIHRASVPVTVVCERSDQAKVAATATGDGHRVLLAVDGSNSAARALEYVCTLRRGGAQFEVELLNVPKPVPALCFESQPMADSYYREQGEAVVDDVKEALRGAGLIFNAHLEAGDAAGKIVEVAERENCTRIVMGTRGLGSIGNLILGSVAYKALQLAPIPVTLVT